MHVLAPESLSFGSVEGLEVDSVPRFRRIEFIRVYGDLTLDPTAVAQIARKAAFMVCFLSSFDLIRANS